MYSFELVTHTDTGADTDMDRHCKRQTLRVREMDTKTCTPQNNPLEGKATDNKLLLWVQSNTESETDTDTKT